MVRGGHDRTAGGPQPTLGVINHRRGKDAQVDAVDACGGQPFHQAA